MVASILRWLMWESGARFPQLSTLITDFFIRLVSTRPKQAANDDFLAWLPQKFQAYLDQKRSRELFTTVARQKNQERAEVLNYPSFDEHWLASNVTIDGREHLDTALQQGRGVLILTAHVGANQMLMPILGLSGYPVSQLGARPDTWHRMMNIRPNTFERRIFAIRQQLERSLPAKFIYLEDSMLEPFRALQRGEVLIMALEGRAGKHWVQVPFLGGTANLSGGPIFIARRVGAALLPAAVLRQHDARGTTPYLLRIFPPVAPSNAEPREEAWRQELESATMCFEEVIRTHPEQYLPLLREAYQRRNSDEVPLFVPEKHRKH